MLDSKRDTSAHAYFKLHLGLKFPVTDSLLKDGWKYLNSCDCGTRYDFVVTLTKMSWKLGEGGDERHG